MPGEKKITLEGLAAMWKAFNPAFDLTKEVNNLYQRHASVATLAGGQAPQLLKAALGLQSLARHTGAAYFNHRNDPGAAGHRVILFQTCCQLKTMAEALPTVAKAVLILEATPATLPGLASAISSSGVAKVMTYKEVQRLSEAAARVYSTQVAAMRLRR